MGEGGSREGSLSFGDPSEVKGFFLDAEGDIFGSSEGGQSVSICASCRGSKSS